MPNTLVLVNVPIPIASIRLGSLVPSFSAPTLDAIAPLAPTSDDLNIAPQTTYRSLVKVYGKTALRPHLAFFGFEVSRDQDVDVIIEATKGMLYELKAPTAWFRRLCANEEAQKWIEKRSMDHKSIFFITGYRTFADARVGIDWKKGSKMGGDADVPLDAIATTAGAGIPVSVGIDVGLERKVEKLRRIEEGYTAPGERIYAVQYRRVKVSWFGSRKVDQATLDEKIFWKDVLKHRGSEKDMDMVEAELSTALRLGKPTEKIVDEGADDEYLVVLEEE